MSQPSCTEIAEALKDFWKGIYAVVELAKSDTVIRKELKFGNSRALIEEAVQRLFADTNTGVSAVFQFPDSWSVRFDECFEHFVVMPDELGEVMLVYVPLPQTGESIIDKHKPTRKGRGRQRLRGILDHDIGNNRRLRHVIYEAAAACGYGCHSETNDGTPSSGFNRRDNCS